MTPRTHSDSLVVGRPPREVYDLVADVTRMGEYSPICKECWWDEGDGPRVGAWFTGRNELPDRTWETRSEVVAADLNRDRVPELIFGTYGPSRGSGRLIVLAASGRRLYDVRLRNQGTDANGVGVAAAPSIGDLNGDGRLEIVVSTFDHGLDVFRVPRSNTKHLPWPTGRGNLRRTG